MTTLGWPDYVGMVSGAIGAFTGIAGAIMGYISYRKANSLKTLDLRLELRKAVTQLHSELPQLATLIDYADKSRTAVAAAIGMSHSGRMEIWRREIETDRKVVAELNAGAPRSGEDYHALTEEDLESKLVDTHRFQIQVNELRRKYEGEVVKDDEERRHLRNGAERRHGSND